MALIAYESPEASPLAHLLSMAQREKVADAINAAVLSVATAAAAGGKGGGNSGSGGGGDTEMAEGGAAADVLTLEQQPVKVRYAAVNPACLQTRGLYVLHVHPPTRLRMSLTHVTSPHPIATPRARWSGCWRSWWQSRGHCMRRPAAGARPLNWQSTCARPAAAAARARRLLAAGCAGGHARCRVEQRVRCRACILYPLPPGHCCGQLRGAHVPLSSLQLWSRPSLAL